MYGIDTPVYVYKAGVSDDLITLRYCRSVRDFNFREFRELDKFTNSRISRKLLL